MDNSQQLQNSSPTQVPQPQQPLSQTHDHNNGDMRNAIKHLPMPVDTGGNDSSSTGVDPVTTGELQATNQSSDGTPTMKTPNSYKYPLLKRYYEFGPWVGRNRKAICLGCSLQTSSSQPDRLLKHLKKCAALSEEDKGIATELMNERTANKRRKAMNLKLKRDEDTDYYPGDGSLGDDMNLSGACNNSILASGGLRKLKRSGDHVDRNNQIDEALTRFIMMCRIPLKAIHSPEFVEFTRTLDPDYRIPSKETITNVLIPGLLNII